VSASRRIRAAAALAAIVALALSGCALSERAPSADTQDFEFDSFDAGYVLLRGDDGDSLLRTTERMTAVFPEYDQNRGIRRAIEVFPSAAAVGFEVVEVTDGEGTGRPFEVDEADGLVEITIAVPEGEFVHGEQTYEVTYQQRGVITGIGESQKFSWDVNGDGWPQPFGSVSATIQLADDLAGHVFGEPFCYIHGDDAPLGDCSVRGADGLFIAEVEDLEPNRSLHVVVEFEPGTFG
jgi:hypothetical protein